MLSTIKKITNLDHITVNRNPGSDKELVIKKYVDDTNEKDTLLRFNQTLQNYLKVSVGSDVYNLTKKDKKQLTDITTTQNGNSGGYLLPSWRTFVVIEVITVNYQTLHELQKQILQRVTPVIVP